MKKNIDLADLIDRLFKSKVKWLTKKRLTLVSLSFIGLTAPIFEATILLTQKNSNLLNNYHKTVYEFDD